MDKPRIVIAMPTYNEAENIGKMLDVLTKNIFPQIKNHDMKVMIIDGHSPDGTWKIVAEKAKKNKAIVLLDEGKKSGLGAAYTNGFNYAIKTLKADGIMEMDADFQHDPNDIPRFLAEFDKGFDYVIGSRYIAGGSIPKDWSFKRKFLSVGGNLFTQTMLLSWNLHDFTTGFRLARAKGFLDTMDFERIFGTKSYAYKMMLLYEMKNRGAKIKEIPINFISREKGWSKMDSEDFVQSLKAIALIWKRRLGIS